MVMKRNCIVTVIVTKAKYSFKLTGNTLYVYIRYYDFDESFVILGYELIRFIFLLLKMYLFWNKKN